VDRKDHQEELLPGYLALLDQKEIEGQEGPEVTKEPRAVLALPENARINNALENLGS